MWVEELQAPYLTPLVAPCSAQLAGPGCVPSVSLLLHFDSIISVDPDEVRPPELLARTLDMDLNREYGNRAHEVLGAAFAQRRKE